MLYPALFQLHSAPTFVADNCTAGNLADGTSCLVKCAAGFSQDTGTTAYTCSSDTLIETPTLTCTVPAGYLCDGVGIDTDTCTPTSCAPGYTGTPGLASCANGGDVDWGFASPCDAIPCTVPAAFGTNIVADNCTAGNLADGTSCLVKCAAGFSQDTGTTAYTCSSDTLIETPTLTCTVPAGYLCDGVGIDTDTCTPTTCAPGYTGTPGLASCANGGDVDWGFASPCDAIPCTVPAAFGTNIVADNCTAGNLADGTSCLVKCAAGFSQDTGTTAYTCSSDTLIETPTLTCTGDVCKVPAGYLCDGAGIDTDTCTPTTCAPGYTGTPGVATCANADADWGFASPCDAIPCTVPAAFGTNIVADNCTAGNLADGTSCLVKCAAGFSQDTGTTAYTCSSDTLIETPTLTCTGDVCKVPAGYLCDGAGIDTDTCTPTTCAPGYTGTPGVATCANADADWGFASPCDGETD
eukprot:gene22662-29812_t